MDDDAILELVRAHADRGASARNPRGHVTLWLKDVPPENVVAVMDWVRRNGGRFTPAEKVPHQKEPAAARRGRFTHPGKVQRQTQLAAGGVPDEVTPAYWVIPLDAIDAD